MISFAAALKKACDEASINYFIMDLDPQCQLCSKIGTITCNICDKLTCKEHINSSFGENENICKNCEERRY